MSRWREGLSEAAKMEPTNGSSTKSNLKSDGKGARDTSTAASKALIFLCANASRSPASRSSSVAEATFAYTARHGSD